MAANFDMFGVVLSSYLVAGHSATQVSLHEKAHQAEPEDVHPGNTPKPF